MSRWCLILFRLVGVFELENIDLERLFVLTHLVEDDRTSFVESGI